MYRKYLKTLEEWLQATTRKPMVVRGARQVGKTWLVRELAKKQNKYLIELNFEKNPSLVDLFSSNDVQAILLGLEATLNKKISVTESILFLDEIQVAPMLLAKLRWFFEDLPALAVIAAGSLLDFALAEHDFSMPVGRITYLYLQPLTFEEFLIATDRQQQYEYLSNWQLEQKIPNVLHSTLSRAVREYVLIGGLPEAINIWQEKKSFISVAQQQQDLLSTYRDDFAKYTKRLNKEYLEEVLQATPNMLGQKFKYSKVNNHAQSSTVKQALDLLVTARIIHKIMACDVTGLPLKATTNQKMFKAILLDIGLTSALLKLTLQAEMLNDEFALDNSGGVAEQFVGQALLAAQPFYQEPEIYYWVREQKNSAAEVDYIIQHAAKIIPVEVKAGKTGTLRSLHQLMALRGLDLAVRFNNDLPSIVDVTPVGITNAKAFKLLSLPFYLTGQLPRLLDSYN